MPSTAEINAQNEASRARQQANRGIVAQAPQQSPWINPYGTQFGTDSIQDQSYYDNYYNDDSGPNPDDMTDEEWEAYLLWLEENSQQDSNYSSEYGSRMPDGPIDYAPNAPVYRRAKEPSIYDNMMENLSESRFGKYLSGITTYDLNSGGNVVPGSGNREFPNLAERNQVPAFGSNIPQQAAQQAQQQEPQSPFLQSLNMERGSEGSPQSNYYDFVQRGGQMNDEQLRQANEKAMSMGTTFDPETGYSRQPYLDRKNQNPQVLRDIAVAKNEERLQAIRNGGDLSDAAQIVQGQMKAPEGFYNPARATTPQVQAPMSVRDTQNMLFDRFGSPTVSGNMNPSESGLETDQQGRMIPGGYADRVEAYLPYEQDAYDREVNQANRRDFSEPFISGADSRDAGNDTPDFRTMARLKGFTGSGVNAQAKILEAEWNRLEEASGANTPESRQVEMRYKMAQTTKILNEISRDNGMTDLDKEVVKDLVPKYNEWRTTEEAQSKSNINKLTGIIRSLDAGDVETGGFINKLPVFSDQARLVFDPSGSDAVDRIRGVAYQSLRATLGAQFTENEGKNLVATYFNPGLDSKMNMDRLIEFSQTMQAVHNSKAEMYQYLDDNQSLKGYKPKNPRGMVESLVNGGSSNRTSAVRANNGAGATRTTSSGATVTLMDSK